jgi:DNA (cytosine-5)-methyltransferase 1
MKPRLGSMFSGVGGLDLAIAEVLDAETVFVADVCKFTENKKTKVVTVGHYEPHRSPCSVLAHRFPGVPNLGDVSLIDWSAWRGLVDIICAGFPCQDVSVAGGRAGLRDGTRSGLWSQVVRAITELQPRLVVLENVPGIFTAPATGDVEPCSWCVGDDPGGDLRALDAVLADLASIGFDADWTVVPASGVGAAHKRERWFCAAYPAGQPWSFEYGDGGDAAA